MYKQRIEFIDLAKGICIILVVLFHICSYYNVSLPASHFFRAFRMPLYFFLSGFFFKTYSGIGEFIKKKTNKLLVPFVFFYLTLSVLLSIFLYRYLGVVIEKAVNFDFFTCLTEFAIRENFPNSPLWFLLCLFEVNILFYICYLIGNHWQKNQVVFLIGISLIIGYFGLVLSVFHVNLPVFIDSSMTSLPFFMMGYVINRHTSILQPNKYDRYSVLIIILCFVFVYVFATGGGFKSNRFGWISFVTLYPCGFLGTIGVMYLAKKIKYLPLVSYWGRYSIMILCTHRMVYQLFAYFLNIPNYLYLKGAFPVVINLTLTMLSYQLLIPFMKQYLPYVTAQKDIIK